MTEEPKDRNAEAAKRIVNAINSRMNPAVNTRTMLADPGLWIAILKAMKGETDEPETEEVATEKEEADEDKGRGRIAKKAK